MRSRARADHPRAAIQIILEHGDAQPYNMKTSGQELNASRGQGEVKQGHNTGR